ncbi:MAG: CDP-alcohol phosphatidyltransferase family protein [Candidatus Diapherotrites archaeon]|nr:CDP-alcohol phosphatidyltransferase family protein [Candidatus Diapherotrites archaeon]
MISRLRPKMGFLQNVLAAPFIFLGIDPNLISVFGLVFAVIGAYFVYSQQWLFALVFFILAPSIDLIDGTVARALRKASPWGNYFETMLDRFVEFVLLGSFVFIFPLASLLALGFSMLVSYAKPRVGLIIITDNRDWPGVGDHADKLLLMMFGLVCASFGFVFVIEYVLYIIATVSLVGVVQRMAYANKLIKEAEKKGTLLPYIKKGKSR